MHPVDLIRSRDGSMSLTKLAASTAHLNMALAFAWVTYGHGFVWEMWVIYGGYALGHAAYDKTMAVVNQYKTKLAEKP